MANSVHQDMATMRADLDSLRDELGQLTKAAADIVADTARTQKARMNGIGADVAETAGSLLDGLKARGRAGVAAVERQIEDRPMTSLLVAFGGSVLIGGVSWLILKLVNRH